MALKKKKKKTKMIAVALEDRDKRLQVGEYAGGG